MSQATLPTLQQLNNMDTEKGVLLLLRILNTSDLSFMYDCLNPATIRDLVETCVGILEASAEQSGLTFEEKTEILGYFSTLHEYVYQKEHGL